MNTSGCLKLSALFLLSTVAWLPSGIAHAETAQPASGPPVSGPAQTADAPIWAFENSDIAPDPAFAFGRLDNGMRYIIRQNATPEGTGMVQMYVDSGALSETDEERGYAHFVEHMAFNGSAAIPEGEMIKLLEREGLAFGADTNASTNYDYTLYKLDLPRNDTDLLNTALMLMRETASELLITQAAVDREKGVVLSEKRVRDTYALRNYIDEIEFLYPGAHFTQRLPIGTEQTLNGATSNLLRGLWDRTYTPGNTALVVVGDFDPATVEQMVLSQFADWAAEPTPEKPAVGPVDFDRQGMTDIFIDPALSEQITVSRIGPYIEYVDSVEARAQRLLRQIGYGIINRRFQRIARQENAPFRDAGIGTGEVFEAARTTNIVVNTGQGEWSGGLMAAALEYRRSLEFGFTTGEVAEQLANIRTAIENAVAGADTRSNSAHVNAALSLLQEDRIPDTPQNGLGRLLAMQETITPQNVLAALQDELVPLDNPLIRFEGRSAPEGGEDAIRAVWIEAAAAPLAAGEQADLDQWAYDDFGPAGQVVLDNTEPTLGIRTLHFANGLIVNLKSTDVQEDRVLVELNIDGGDMLNTRDAPLVTGLVNGLPIGGLGKHSQDDLQTVLAGRSVALALGAGEETFRSRAGTTPRDLELQLQVMTALITDPGYRTEGEVQFRRNIANFFARANATPNDALGNALGGILSDDDPRFTLQPEADYQALNFARLKADISDRLAQGAMELAIVGDFDEDAAIAMVARTLGALPRRETAFRPYSQNRQRGFTANRSARTIYHDGQANQALVQMIWPTRDESDLADHLALELLERVMRLQLTDTLREELGQTYSPGVNASQSRAYPDYGTFSLSAAVDVDQITATRQAMLDTVTALIASPVDDDTLLRARKPLIESYENALKTNNGWMRLVDRAASQPEHIARFHGAREMLPAFTPADIQAMAARYLSPSQLLEVLVLPRPAGLTKAP